MTFHIVSEGDGPTILFIHAGVADSRMWRHQMGMRGFRTVAYDQRGFGKTQVGAEPYSDREDALAVLDQVGAKSAVVVGCSIGADTAMDLAIENPERVDKLVLVGGFPSGWMPESGWEENPLEEEREEAAKAGDIERAVEIDLQMWLVGYGRSEADVNQEHRALFWDMDRIPIQTSTERNALIRYRHYKLNDQLGRISVPTLVVCGAHDEKLLLDSAHYLAERLSNTSAVIIEGAAHLPSLERHDEFNTVLSAFLSD